MGNLKDLHYLQVLVDEKAIGVVSDLRTRHVNIASFPFFLRAVLCDRLECEGEDGTVFCH